jgi:hypothetical protein
MPCDKSGKSKHRERRCLKSLKEINDLEVQINIELEKAKLLLSVLNCDSLATVKPELSKIFETIKKLEDEVTTTANWFGGTFNTG